MSTLNVLLFAIAATAVWTLLGMPLARRLTPDPALGSGLAPILGWAASCPLVLLADLLLGFTRTTVAVQLGAAMLASLAFILLRNSRSGSEPSTGLALPWWAFVAAGLLAIAPAIAIMPKLASDGVILAAPIFDHSKVAIVDDIARSGLPPGNPFFGVQGAPSQLPYYYLWHFGAAAFALLLGIGGWEADIGCAWFTAFASLLLMMGLAVRLSERRSAALIVALLGLTSSLRLVLAGVLGEETLQDVLAPGSMLQTWIVQATWSPQHLASASCAILAVYLMSRLARERSPLAVLALAVTVAAGFESSTWIGGITFAAAALPVGGALLISAEPVQRIRFLRDSVLAALLAAAIALPMIRDQYLATVSRGAGIPIALHPLEVFGPLVPSGLRRILDLLAFWPLVALIEFPAIFIAGVCALAQVVRAPSTPSGSRPLALALGLLAFAGLAVGWLFMSTIANNDLGWRSMLPAVMVLTAFAAAGLSRWLARPSRIGAVALVLIVLGLPDGIDFIRDNAVGRSSASAAAFAESPALWRAVRRHAREDERIGSNPAASADMTVWPINISWALLANRRSCYAGWALAKAFVALPDAELVKLDTLFTAVFAGKGSQGDVHLIATQYRCRVIVVTAQDGAWARDPFAASADYRLVEEAPMRWRIYRATGG